MSEVFQIPLDKIVIRDRSREIDHDWAKMLAAAIKETEMLNPVTLWRDGEEAVLVAGLHRIEAHLINGETMIECRWSQAETLADAKILETSENLLRNELTKLDRAQHLAELKDAYEEKFPETKAGVAGGKATKSTRGIIPFVEDAAEKIGLSDSAVKKAVAMWHGLSDASRRTIKGTWLANHQAGLMVLSHEDHPKQEEVLDLMFPSDGSAPDVTNVPDAILTVNGGKRLTPQERIADGFDRLIGKLSDDDLDAVLSDHQERILAWAKRFLDRGKS